MKHSFRQEVDRALAALETDRKGLTRRLGLSIGTLRAWETRGAPAYGRLLMAAIVAGIEPEAPFDGLDRRTNEARFSAQTITSDADRNAAE